VLNIENGFLGDIYGHVDQIIGDAGHRHLSVAVITPTTGSLFLGRAIQSVFDQDHGDIDHLIVVDGLQFEQQVRQILSGANSSRCTVCVLPFNTGKDGLLSGHRIYASFPLLVNSKYILFLDEDNWWDPEHVSSMVALLGRDRVDWAHSMRKIYTHDEVYVADDNCESIGMYPPYSHLKNGWPSYVDTNCYAFRRSTIAQTAHYWYHPRRGDRYFFHNLCAKFPSYLSSKKYTVNYRLKENGPVPPDYIVEGNRYMMEKYSAGLPWL
jgi:glycosyltransferase involved in cell wall biosynthesis